MLNVLFVSTGLLSLSEIPWSSSLHQSRVMVSVRSCCRRHGKETRAAFKTIVMSQPLKKEKKIDSVSFESNFGETSSQVATQVSGFICSSLKNTLGERWQRGQKGFFPHRSTSLLLNHWILSIYIPRKIQSHSQKASQALFLLSVRNTGQLCVAPRFFFIPCCMLPRSCAHKLRPRIKMH